jgi:UDP-GlcNAc:undecaprenyl-phosphate/decaprenyl-phosphate GlcNAc-1-phosphate transferase
VQPVIGNALLALAAATVLALAGTALARRVALAVGFVDRPGPTKIHAQPVAYLGGVAILLATLGGWLTGQLFTTRMVVLAIVGAGVCLLGLVDDYRELGPWMRLTAEAAAASTVVLAGIRAQLFGIPALDIAITLVWIVGVTNAFNLTDNTDGLAAGVALGAAGGVSVLAALGGQDPLATAIAAVAGACAGFLVHNWRPATIFMGDAGALFLGFVIAVGVLDLRPAVTQPASLGVPLLLLALPVVDTAVVMVARFRYHRPLMSGGKDHLSHRLVSFGCAPSVAVVLLLAVQASLSALAVLAGRAVVPMGLALACGGTVLGALLLVAARARVYEQAPLTIWTRLLLLIDHKPTRSQPVLQPAVEVESPGATAAQAAELAKSDTPLS